MGKSWDDASEKQLLLSVIHVLNVTAPDWNRVAAMMGEGYTASAVMQKFNKIKKACKEQYGDAAASPPPFTATPKATPGSGAKRGRPKKAASESAAGAGNKGKGKGKGKGKKNHENGDVSEDDEEEEEVETPSKRVKKEESLPADDDIIHDEL
ncbi:Hypothetical predicted protein [Lecanosticta acicola]|uniref:Myb-like domain-containing protein n=1 Tax=Lecanosticta acicola TaxID=111012 RepID=A0AAI8YSX4_9PEZI|nr:Hypothetical predicted protein [Lecanosticta acicola]